jgi:transposase
MTMRDELELRYKDSDFAALFPSHRGRPAESPGRLALVTVMQYAEGLTDRQAAEAVRSRIDWKYGLGLTLTDSGFHHSILGAFRERLIDGGAEQQLLEDMLKQCKEQGLLKARGRQRTDSTHVLAAIRELNRLECIGETLRNALNNLAVVVPDWLREQVSPDWFELYGPRFEQYRLPKGKQKRQELAERIGADGYHLLSVVYGETAPRWLREVPAVDILRQVWIQQFVWDGEHVALRQKGNLPPAAVMIQSPHDTEAQYSKKRQTEWNGYTVHVTETCDDEAPHLITNIETVPATTPDKALTGTIHDHLAEKDFLPQEHLVDAGYVDIDEVVDSRDIHNIELLGPVPGNTAWQAKAGQGFATDSFLVDWERQTITCPLGRTSRTWYSRRNGFGNDVIEVRFDRHDCGSCSSRPLCTRSANRGRSLTIRPRTQYMALKKSRAYQQTTEFRERYKQRAGVEGTISQGIRAFGLRRARYIGLTKTRLQHSLTGAAINLTRAVYWLQGRPLAETRCSHFAALAPAS